MTFYFICGSFQASYSSLSFPLTLLFLGLKHFFSLAALQHRMCKSFFQSYRFLLNVASPCPLLGLKCFHSFIHSINKSYTQNVIMYFRLKQSSLRVIYWFRDGSLLRFLRFVSLLGGAVVCVCACAYVCVHAHTCLLLSRVKKDQNIPCMW